MEKFIKHIPLLFLLLFFITPIFSETGNSHEIRNEIPDAEALKSVQSIQRFLNSSIPTRTLFSPSPLLPNKPLPFSSESQVSPILGAIHTLGARVDELDQRTAAHLLHRTIFGPKWEEIETAVFTGLSGTLNTLFSELSAPEPPGEWIDDPIPPYDELDAEALDSLINAYSTQFGEMRSWWIDLMIGDETTIREVMALFWHDHFATSGGKVFYPPAMYNQNALIRNYALGNIKEFVKVMAFDPAMLIWLDNNQNHVGAINENFARELLELFTIGVGNYTQIDIIEAARAYTGYRTDGLNTYFMPDHHDYGLKTFMGQTGNWFGDDIVDIIFEQDETARFLCRKLYSWFLYNFPDESVIDELAAIMRDNDYEVEPVLRALLSSDHFFDENFRGAKYRSPVYHTASIVRQTYTEITALDSEHPKNIILMYVNELLGQATFFPPDVSGWVSYRTWVNTYTLPWRKIYTNGVIDGFIYDFDIGFQSDIMSFILHIPSHNDAEQLIDDLALYFYAMEPSEHTTQLLLNELLQGAEPYDWNINLPDAEGRLRGTVKLLMRLPDYQLK
tara:strand:+ start:29331 stop:31013 length:1683 start_codon:yes stop_codon:yes gene_type:complete